MQFEWDEAKRWRILRERGLDFVEAWQFFDGRPAVSEMSRRGDEERWRSTAAIGPRMITMIWMWRGETVRVITMRRAHAREESQYRALFR
jgi:uncharacterized DUF497 family protein